jgi:predicted dehydrogenase
MKGKLKVGIVGAGKRVHEMYAPVLNSNPDIEVSGFWNRDAAKGQKLTDAFGYTRYTDLAKLARESEALVIVVNSSALTQVEMECISYGKPLMAETPVWTKDVVTAAQKAGIPFQIAEQTPWLPTEQFKVDMIRASEFGRPHTVVNDFRTFEYHGIAQLRRYIGFDKVATEVCGMSHGVPMAPFRDGNDVEQRGHVENWESGQIRFATGELAVYNFSSLYNRCKYRQPQSLRIYTDRASVVNDDSKFTVNIGNDDASYSEVRVTSYNSSAVPGKTTSIIGELYNRDGDLLATYPWQSLTDHLTNQQEALKVLVDNFADHIITGGAQRLKYDASQGWTDFNLLMAIRHSGQAKRYISR